MKKMDYVTASEIGEFLFCKRGWWLRINGFLKEPTEAMKKGIALHEKLATDIERNTQGKKLAYSIIALGIILLLLALLFIK